VDVLIGRACRVRLGRKRANRFRIEENSVSWTDSQPGNGVCLVKSGRMTTGMSDGRVGAGGVEKGRIGRWEHIACGRRPVAGGPDAAEALRVPGGSEKLAGEVRPPEGIGPPRRPLGPGTPPFRTRAGKPSLSTGVTKRRGAVQGSTRPGGGGRTHSTVVTRRSGRAGRNRTCCFIGRPAAAGALH